MILEKDQELMETLHQLLEAYKLGFSTFSSPVNPLMRIMIDLALKLSNLFKEGRERWDHPVNKSIRFLDGISGPWEADALGNPRQIYSRVPQKSAYDPQLAEFFSNLALDLVLIKRSKFLPKDLYSFKDRNYRRDKPKKASYHYFRRTRDKRKKHIT